MEVIDNNEKGVFMEYFAHIRHDQKIQTVKEHLLGTQSLAESYGRKLGIQHITGLAGLLHDLGKYTQAFRTYLLEAVSHPENPPKRGSVDHSTAGGKLLYDLFHISGNLVFILAEIVGNAIISHHSCLQDFLSPSLTSPYLKRVRDKPLQEFERCKQLFFQQVMNERDLREYVKQASKELESFLVRTEPEDYEKSLMFLTKFIFSALIDADRTDTWQFENNWSSTEAWDTARLFANYEKHLHKKFDKLQKQFNGNPKIQYWRQQFSKQCGDFAKRPSGIYKLSIPTGGGKTFASLLYALKHAQYFQKKRIIYVLPYTTIIEQNANEVRKALGDTPYLLEHHSNLIEDRDEDDKNPKWKLAKDNWEAPLIFTTMVQFLNVFYAYGTRYIRRLHNLSESVIIFDEVQKVPIHCVSLFNQALNFLKSNCRTSIVLCTATQPALDFVEKKLEIETDAEMISPNPSITEAFRRVQIVDQATQGTFDNEQLSQFITEKMKEVQSILVILNTRSVVKKLYLILKNKKIGIPIYHLSTSMCAAHRIHTLEKVRDHLKKGEPVLCISTQLIEAGVDISFDCVIRSLAGLDSIAQAAGRCNRNGKNPNQNVYVIDHVEENLDRLPEIQIEKRITKQIFRHIHQGFLEQDPLSTQAMNRYFQQFYAEHQLKLEYPIPSIQQNMTDLLMATRETNENRKKFEHEKKQTIPLFLLNSYGTAAKHFRVIDDFTTSVIVPYAEGQTLIEKFCSSQSMRQFEESLWKAQQYTIDLFDFEKQQLVQQNELFALDGEKLLVLCESAYSDEVGLDLDGEEAFNPEKFTF